MREIYAKIIPALKDVIAELEKRTAKPHKFQGTSALQRMPIYKNIDAWVSGGKVGPKPDFSSAEFRLLTYNQSFPARQLETFIHVSAISSLEISQIAVAEFESGNIIAPSILLRSLIERIAHAAALLKFVSDLPNISAPTGITPIEPLLDLSEKINQSLFGTRLDWGKLSTVDFHNASAKKMRYEKQDLLVDLGGFSNILTSVDKLDKRIPGTRLAYDVLCEFLHPNVGDLHGTTVNSYAFTDRHNLRHLNIELDTGAKNFGGNPQLNFVMIKLFDICSDAIRYFPIVLNELDTVRNYAINMTQLFIHKVIQKNRPDFKNDDLCPCLSGLKVKQCIRKTKGKRRIKKKLVH